MLFREKQSCWKNINRRGFNSKRLVCLRLGIYDVQLFFQISVKGIYFYLVGYIKKKYLCHRLKWWL